MISRRSFLGAAVAPLGARLLAGRDEEVDRRQPAIATPPFDVCIVGSGFAGTFLALQLVESGLRTAIVEAGGRLGPVDPPEGRIDRLPIVDSGGTGFRVDGTRTVGVGGTSHRWAGFATRLRPDDFRMRSRFGLLVDWPIGYADLEPFYRRAETLLGARAFSADRPLRFEVARTQAPTGLRVPFDFRPVPFSSRHGKLAAIRLADVEVPRFEASPLGTLLAERSAVRFLPGKGGVRGLEIRRPDGAIEVLEARAFVIAAGTPESARLLLNSGLLENGWVGSHFNAHPRLTVRLPRHPEVGLPPGLVRADSLSDLLRGEGLNAAHVDLRVERDDARLEFMIEMEPSTRNRLILDPPTTQTARLHLEWSPSDRRTVAAVSELGQALAARLGRPEDLVEVQPLDWFHPAGVCRMADRPELGAVDPNLRVFGTDNLFAVGASVFPTSGSGNPTLTIVALALRLGDHLLATLATLR